MRVILTILTLTSLLADSFGQKYYAYVAAESEDEVAVVSFVGISATVEEKITVGYIPKEIEGPHGLAVDPSGAYWYVSMAHGNPYGFLYKYSTDTNELLGRTTLGLFPATMEVSKMSGFLYIVNFNLHGTMEPSTVSIVDPESMVELKKVKTGTMPHGSRITPDGRWHYSLAMMSGELFEIDALSLELSRTLNLDRAVADYYQKHPEENKLREQKMPSDMAKMGSEQMSGMGKMNGANHSKVKPTWVIPHPNDRKVYVAANGADFILEIDLEKWAISRKFNTGKGPYNVEVSPDGKKLLSTYKSEAKLGIWDLETGKELARVENTRKICHGIAITPDSKYAFVTVEGIGGEPGTVDIIDLEKLAKVAHVEIGKQAGGIAFWKMID